MSDLDLLVARAQAGGIDRVYKLGDLPKAPAYPYTVLSAYRMPSLVRSLDGSGDTPSRFTAQHFGKSAESVTANADACLAAFDGVSLDDLADAPTCWAEVTTPPYRDPDDGGVLNVTHTYRYS